MASFIQGIFSQKLVEDDRHQMELFTSDLIGKSVCFRGPSISFWIQVLLVNSFAYIHLIASMSGLKA